MFAHSFSPLPLGLYVTSPVSPYSVSRALFGALWRYLLNALRFGLVRFYPPCSRILLDRGSTNFTAKKANSCGLQTNDSEIRCSQILGIFFRKLTQSLLFQNRLSSRYFSVLLQLILKLLSKLKICRFRRHNF